MVLDCYGKNRRSTARSKFGATLKYRSILTENCPLSLWVPTLEGAFASAFMVNKALP